MKIHVKSSVVSPISPYPSVEIHVSFLTKGNAASSKWASIGTVEGEIPLPSTYEDLVALNKLLDGIRSTKVTCSTRVSEVHVNNKDIIHALSMGESGSMRLAPFAEVELIIRSSIGGPVSTQKSRINLVINRCVREPRSVYRYYRDLKRRLTTGTNRN